VTLSKSRRSKKKVTRRGNRLAFVNPDSLKLPPEAYRSDGSKFAVVRLRNPDNPKEYVNWPGRRHPFVTRGYQIWTLEEWRQKHGDPDPNVSPSSYWEFFGEPIDIWEGYSEE
jgi:hypothetical protein